MIRRSAFLLSLIGIILALITIPSARLGSAQTTDSLNANSALHHIKTVFVIIMENHNWTGAGKLNDIQGNPASPYLSYTLVPMASHANNYWNPPHLHPSLPNYIWLEAGSNLGLTGAVVSPQAHPQTTHEHLTYLLQKAGISWKAYAENLDGRSCPVTRWHTPFEFFDDVTNNMDPQSANCIAHLRPFSEMKGDLENDRVARYNFIEPSLCDDMHNYCGESQIVGGDEWLALNVPTILNSTAYRSGGALFIVWDEASIGDGPIPMIVLSPFAKGNGYSNKIHYTHGSTLRTIQEIFGVGPLLRDAAKEADLGDLFKVFP
jgi:phosphatidylinositol-3-phosphatase